MQENIFDCHQIPTLSVSLYCRKYYSDFYETHPVKKLATNIKPKPVKHKGPVTRASSHLKSVVTSAKLAATRKLRILRRAHQTPRRDYSKLSHSTDVKRRSSETPKSSPSSSDQKSSPSPKKGRDFSWVYLLKAFIFFSVTQTCL